MGLGQSRKELKEVAQTYFIPTAAALRTSPMALWGIPYRPGSQMSWLNMLVQAES